MIGTRTIALGGASAIILLLLAASGSSAEDCFTVIVGRNASANGCVMLAHTEDISPQPVVNHYKIPRKKYVAGETLRLLRGAEIEQAAETWEYIWSEVPGEEFSDSYLNEWGVFVASNMCPSKENNPELSQGGIGYMLRRIVAERARSAREGVLLAGKYVERFGYVSSGRTYAICDPDEGWLFCVINGRYWLAQRVPDDEVAVFANSYTVRKVELDNGDNFLASSDLIEYATRRGWYRSGDDVVFDFAKVFADSVSATASFNVCRQWSGLNHLIDDTLPADWFNLPFSLKPDNKVTVFDLMRILRDHYENTALYRLAPESNNPHENQFMTICSRISQVSFVVELRRNLPKEIGFTYWLSLGKPCYSFFVPFYFGIERFPAEYYTQAEKPDSIVCNTMLTASNFPKLKEAFWQFSNFCHKMDSCYIGLKPEASIAQNKYDDSLMNVRVDAEIRAVELYKRSKSEAIEFLEKFSYKQYLSALRIMDSKRLTFSSHT
jgi:dipeptidase